MIAENCAINNEAGIECRGGHYRAVGGNTEAALIVLAEKLGVADRSENEHLAQLRNQDPERHSSTVCSHYHSRYMQVCMNRIISSCRHSPLFLIFL